jgi:TRAP-type C4-dicarboxylate transport system substrate-binding protein
MVLAMSAVFLLSFSPAIAQTKPIELTYSNQFVASHQMAVLAKKWGDEIEKRTKGRVKITLFAGGTLTPAPAIYDGVVKGISDIGMSFTGFTKGRFPLMEVIDLPLVYKNGLAATRLINELYEKFKPKEFDDVKIMYLHAHGPGFIHTRRPVNKLEDLKGMKIRSTGVSAKLITALGGTPVAMPMGEAYDAINRGVTDGTVAPYEALEQWKLGEVIKYTIETYACSYSAGAFVVMNKNRWNSLPPDIQEIIESIDKEWIDPTGKLWDEIDKSGKEFTLKRGNKVITLSREEDARWARATKSVLDDYVKYAQEKGVPGGVALKFCLERLRQLQ